MKNIRISAAFVLLLGSFALSFNSCKKEEDEGKLPSISFKSGSGYTNADATVAKSSVTKIGINAAKTEDKDVLKKFTITLSRNAGTDSTVYTKDLSGSEGDNFSYDYTATAPANAGTDKYTFTVVNRDGLINKVSLTLTIQ
jgi:hypothetical protein